MEKINFVNNQQPAINDTNLNKLQQNVENDIGDLTDLETSANNNLVEAINEAKRSGGDAVPIYSIFDYDGDTVPTGYEEVNSYSTSEVKTGDTWIDGKPIYRIVFTGTVSSGWTDVSISSINYDTIYINGNATHFVFIAGDTTYNKAGYYYDATDWATVQIQPTTKKISIGAGSKLSNINYTIVLEYTKTTD